MKFTAEREQILGPLQSVMGVVERRQTMPILANVLVVVRDGTFSVTATDLEVELVARGGVKVDREGEITVPGRKFLDIVKALPTGLPVTVELKGEKVEVKCGRSRFTLSSLPATEYPTVEEINATQTLELAQADLKRLLEKCSFSMAHQDVRYYLNGLLLETDGRMVRTVATDGHRLAVCDRELDTGVAVQQQIIVPRKGVTELVRMLSHLDGEVSVGVGQNHMRVSTTGQSITTKLIDGKFPDYERVIPKEGEKLVTADREALKAAFSRTSILSNEKFRGVRISLTKGLLKAAAHNPEQEEAEEDIEVDYAHDDLEIGFNVSYLLDVLGVLKSQSVRMELSDSNSSCVLYAPEDMRARYVVMPMRL